MPPAVQIDRFLLEAKLSVPPAAPWIGESCGAHRRRPGERLPRRRRHRAGGLRQVDAAGGVGAHGGSPRSRGCPSTASTTTPRPADPAGVGLCAGLAGQHRPGRRHGWPGRRCLGRAAPRLASAFQASPDPFVLMLDDLHELQSPDCHDVLSVVIAGIPAGSQLVAASRSEQPHLARLRASGDALEFVRGRPGPRRRRAPSRSSPQAHVDISPRDGRRGDRTDRGLAGRVCTSPR